ncbi:methyltransferase domain-containing protein [Streptomyces coryli]|uniref:methyltransferase domain-containing protein n=1 Tax=Streptomyces coryli TaxID=1128680 RepID=UPI0019CFD2BC|nr:methyltransferase domain-containing protein [Streptomyces coryli]
MTADLGEADGQALPFDDACFDTDVCTLGLNAIPDDRAAVGETHRVLRPGGRLLLLGHVASHHLPVRLLQRLLEKAAVRMAADHQTRRPCPVLVSAGFTIEEQVRSRAGVIQRISAVKGRRSRSRARS